MRTFESCVLSREHASLPRALESSPVRSHLPCVSKSSLLPTCKLYSQLISMSCNTSTLSVSLELWIAPFCSRQLWIRRSSGFFVKKIKRTESRPTRESAVRPAPRESAASPSWLFKPEGRGRALCSHALPSPSAPPIPISACIDGAEEEDTVS